MNTPILLATARGAVEVAMSGEGPAVLLLHGAMGGWDQSTLLGRAALGEQGYRRLAVSRPGYLGSPLALGPSPERQADLYAALLDACGFREAAVAAISGGGQSAVQFALRHRERCRALILISACTATLPGDVPWRFQLMRVLAHFPKVLQSMSAKSAERSIPDAELRARTLAHPEAGPLMLELQQSTWKDTPRRMAGTRNDIANARAPFAYPLEEVGVPVLAIHGTEDEAVPFAHAVELARRVKGAELVEVVRGRHVTLFTHLDLVRERVAGLLKRTGLA